MGAHRRLVAVIYNAYEPAAGAGHHEAAESISHDAERVRAALAARGDRVSLVPLRRSVGGFLRRLRSLAPDLVFNLVEEAMGDCRHEMSVRALVDLLGLPCTGCGPLALGVCLDKALTKRILAAAGIPTPRFLVADGGAPPAIPRGMRPPFFVKPVRHDASIGIGPESFVSRPADLAPRCRAVAERYGQPALVEEYVEGRELNVALMGNRLPVALPVSEIDMRGIPAGAPRVCDYRAKWIPGSSEYERTVPVCPAPLAPRLERRVRETALACWRLLSCRGYARVDIRLDAAGTPYVLEVNPNPCISPDSGMARSAAAAGMGYAALIARIADLATA
ncbi:MAG: ATP-grasp domain-containing protein [bacterium]|nr:ATP-grasp domain-containing protein [bacterium]